MIQRSMRGPPGVMALACGSNPVKPRRVVRARSEGMERASWVHSQRFAAAAPRAARRSWNSRSRSAQSSSRSASGTIRRNRAIGRRRTRVMPVLYIVEGRAATARTTIAEVLLRPDHHGAASGGGAAVELRRNGRAGPVHLDALEVDGLREGREAPQGVESAIERVVGPVEEEAGRAEPADEADSVHHDAPGDALGVPRVAVGDVEDQAGHAFEETEEVGGRTLLDLVLREVVPDARPQAFREPRAVRARRP